MCINIYIYIYIYMYTHTHTVSKENDAEGGALFRDRWTCQISQNGQYVQY